jgi:hypothetical protein
VRCSSKKVEAALLAQLLGQSHQQLSDLEYVSDIELLTALRRVQKKTDPLTIATPKLMRINTGKVVQSLTVSISNTDPEGIGLLFEEGGDDRSGRRERWKLLIVDHPEVSILEPPNKQLGGGLLLGKVLKSGEAVELDLDIRAYIKIPPPGNYKGMLLFHHNEHIGQIRSVNDLTIFASKEFPVIVE